MKHLFSLTTAIAIFLTTSGSNASFFDGTEGYYQDGYDACIKKMEDCKMLMAFRHLTPEQKADHCVDLLKQHHPEIIKVIHIPTFIEGVVQGVYKNNVSKGE